MGVVGCSRRCSKSTLLCAERKNCQKRCKDKNGQFLKHESSANEFLRTPASKLPQVVSKSHETGYPIHSQVPLPEGADHYPQVVRWTRASGTTGGKGEVPSLAKEGWPRHQVNDPVPLEARPGMSGANVSPIGRNKEEWLVQ